ncbi:hypothetical protein AWL63_20245 [Sphingomonas panacis]|uniref:EamA domain-containing protein n=1 Tax=Sphingomonas panacis TaxID=1560345 RepID=A0A1B3ZET8_9SPHN|nr:EamA family transporter [Sphingomonas panacis]AOH85941.1 hypothetical protein AWL63_20245 [Sphingomonas panacis]
MIAAVFPVILVAAALHATWNAIIRGGEDRGLMTALVTGSAAAIAVIGLPFLPPPVRQSWPFLAGSAVLSISYYGLVAWTYRVAEMSRTYPLMRGAAPLLVAIASTTILGEPLRWQAWCGVAVICAGILGVAGNPLRSLDKGAGLASLNAVVIAGYTMVDGAGVRHSGTAAAYTLWIFLLTGIPMTSWAIFRRGHAFRVSLGRNWRLGIVGGASTTASYGLALWAMTLVPVAIVAALRETAILFGVLISAVFLKEPVGPGRVIAAVLITAGAALLRAS